MKYESETILDHHATEVAISTITLPPLDGPADEAACAEPIRAAQIVALDDLLSRIREEAILANHDRDPDTIDGSTIHAAEAALQRLRRVVSPQWWLDRRTATAEMLLSEELSIDSEYASPA